MRLSFLGKGGQIVTVAFGLAACAGAVRSTLTRDDGRRCSTPS